MVEQFNNCVNRHYTRGFTVAIMQQKAMRSQTARYIAPVTERGTSGTRSALEIVGHRICAGISEYLVLWADIAQPTWVDSDNLSCYELIEEFQAKND